MNTGLLYFCRKSLTCYRAVNGQLVPSDYPKRCKVKLKESDEIYSFRELANFCFPRYAVVEEEILTKASDGDIARDLKYKDIVKELKLEPGTVVEFLDYFREHVNVNVHTNEFKGKNFLIPTNTTGKFKLHKDDNFYQIQDIFKRYIIGQGHITISFQEECDEELTFKKDCEIKETFSLAIDDVFKNKILMVPFERGHGRHLEECNNKEINLNGSILDSFTITERGIVKNVYMIDIQPEVYENVRKDIKTKQERHTNRIPNPLLATADELRKFNTEIHHKEQKNDEGATYVTMHQAPIYEDILEENEENKEIHLRRKQSEVNRTEVEKKLERIRIRTRRIQSDPSIKFKSEKDEKQRIPSIDEENDAHVYGRLSNCNAGENNQNEELGISSSNRNSYTAKKTSDISPFMIFAPTIEKDVKK